MLKKISEAPGCDHKRAGCEARVAAVGDALYAIGGKWKLRIVLALGNEDASPKRFNELQRLVRGISARVLSAELKELELNGFVTRKVIDQKPVVVEYQLTEYSQSLEGVLHALTDWGTRHRERIRQMAKQESI
jgi:DNA-binding HxlR family transcriptional regulator